MLKLRLVRFWGVLGLLLVLAVSAQSQWVNITVRTYQVYYGISEWPVIFKSEPRVVVRMVCILSGEHTIATSDHDGVARLRARKGTYVYFVSTKSGFRATSSFIFQVVAEGQEFYAPIITEEGYQTFAVRMAALGGVVQDPNRSVILAIFHPEGALPTSRERVSRGVAIDSRSYYPSFPDQLVNAPPPGERRWLGHIGPRFRCLRDYRVENFVPFALIIYNAERYGIPFQRTPAYRLDFIDTYPRILAWVCAGGVFVPGAAPTPADITIGIVYCLFRVFY